MSIVRLMKSQEAFVSMNGANTVQINEAEEALGLKFSKEYIAYVSEFGAASFAGHEFTGVCNSQRLNVVTATERVRKTCGDVDLSWYVVEETHVDGIVIWQTRNGKVYKTAPNEKAIKIADSLAEYITK